MPQQHPDGYIEGMCRSPHTRTRNGLMPDGAIWTRGGHSCGWWIKNQDIKA